MSRQRVTCVGHPFSSQTDNIYIYKYYIKGTINKLDITNYPTGLGTTPIKKQCNIKENGNMKSKSAQKRNDETYDMLI